MAAIFFGLRWATHYFFRLTISEKKDMNDPCSEQQ